eukprot:Phypoly_transcript_11870.p1 GENE.Phypoly_transcript_11870~~Phypoly_transcript_11870.p1  ORF type:complete len:325 (+),score=32.36 Phypoly_transcript_11870:183-1157(+)
MILSRRVPSILPSLPLQGFKRNQLSSFRPIHQQSGHFKSQAQHNNTLFYVCLGALSVALYSTTKRCESEADQRPKSIVGGNNFKFKSAATMFPHPDKEYKGGEDAYFVSDNGLAIGVADGVGGWASKGVDPAIYARALMEGAKRLANSHPDISDPISLMEAGYINASQHLGSSTCCIVVLSGSHVNSANLGDSGFMVIRGDKIVYRTKEQQHRFNFPFQLGNTSKDKPQHSDIATVPVQSGDIVILGTDGLFDNLYDSQILSCVVQYKSANKPQQLSDAVATLAREYASHRTGSSPFSDGSTKFGRPRQGGKMDDITVVVGIVA